MFKIKKIELFNWSYFPPFTPIYLDESLNLLIGENGSGKTSLMDAIRIGLGGQAYSVKGATYKREFRSYLLNGDEGIIKLLITNREERGESIFGRLKQAWNGPAEMSLICHILLPDRIYYVAPGDLSIRNFRATVKDLKGTPVLEKMPSIDYYANEILRPLGVGPSFIKAISQEQGRVPDFIGMTDEQLFREVTQIVEIRNVLEEYHQQKEAYRQAREREETDHNRVERSRLEAERLMVSVERYNTYVKEVEQLIELERIFYPIIRHKEVIQELDQKDNEKVAVMFSLVDQQRTQTSLEEKKKAFDKEEHELKEQFLQWDEESKSVSDQNAQISAQKAVLEERIRRYEDETKQVLSLPPELFDYQNETIDSLNSGVASRKTALEQVREELGRMKGSQEELNREINGYQAQLQQQIKYPRSLNEIVNRMAHMLSDAKIRHHVVADLVEVVDPKWKRAVEGVLGGRRFDIVVAQEDLLEAKRVGQKQRYRFKVMKGMPLSMPVRKESLLSKIKVTDNSLNVLGRLAFLDRFICVETLEEGDKLSRRGISSITPDAYEQDEEGSGISRWIDDEDFCCGRLAQERQKEQIRQRLALLQQQWGTQDQKIQKMAGNLEDVGRQLQIYEKSLELKKREPSHQSDRAAFELIQKEWIGLQDDLNTIWEAKRELDRKQDELKKAQLDLTSQLTGITGTIRQAENRLRDLDAARGELISERGLLQEQVEQIPQEQIPVLMRYQNSGECKQEIDHFQRKRKEYEAEAKNPTDPAVVLTYQYHVREAEKYGTLYEESQKLKERSQEAYFLAKEKYFQHIDGVLSDIEKSLRIYAERLGVTVNLIKKVKGEDTLGIDYQIGYPGKKISTVLSRRGLSGGEAAVANIMFFLAVTNLGGSHIRPQFLILDEHASNLDNERMQEVENFFLSTRMQCLFSTPKYSEVKLFQKVNNFVLFSKEKRQQFWQYPKMISKKELTQSTETARE